MTDVVVGDATWTVSPAGVVTRASLAGRVVFDSMPPGLWEGMGDPRYTGIGSFGLHAARYVTAPFFHGGRHVETLRAGEWGVLTSGVQSAGTPFVTRAVLGDDIGRGLVLVENRWRFRPRSASLVSTVELLAGFPVWAKEPKLGLGGLDSAFAHRVRVLDRAGETILWGRLNLPPLETRDLTVYTHPKEDTLQVPQRRRRHLLLTGPAGSVRVTSGGMALDGVVVHDSAYEDYGLGCWRRWAQYAPRLSDLGQEKGYCYCTVLRPTWEIARWPDRAAVLLHAWTGGSGFQDCLCAYRPFPPVGTRYRSYLGVTVGLA